jgi:hypothetical protein
MFPYEQGLAEALRPEAPLSPAIRERLQQMQKEWQLSDEDIAPIESRMAALRPPPVPPQAVPHEQTQPHNSSFGSRTSSQMTPEDFDKRGNDKYDTKDYEETREDYQKTIAQDDSRAQFNPRQVDELDRGMAQSRDEAPLEP